MEIMNEIVYLIISYHLIGFTDINKSIKIKQNVGYSMITISIMVFIYPNLFIIIYKIIHDITAFWRKRAKRDVTHLEKSRKYLIYSLQPKDFGPEFSNFYELRRNRRLQRFKTEVKRRRMLQKNLRNTIVDRSMSLSIVEE
jgi:hypothetical protein